MESGISYEAEIYRKAVRMDGKLANKQQRKTGGLSSAVVIYTSVNL